MVLAHNIDENQRTADVQISQNISFDNMLLSDFTLNGLKESGFFKPSPIQLHGIPLGKCGFDLLLEAKSGTGKTAVFAVIALEKIDLTKGLQVIILAPTREIAFQICDVLRQIGSKYDGLHVEVVMGGLPIQDDINKFTENKIHIVVGSPGRLKHLIHDKHIDTNAVRLLVLDEADKLIEKSFIADIKFIHFSLPSQKQVILSSATFPENSKEIISQFVHDAQHICPNSNCILLGVAQKVTYVKYNSNIVKQTEYRFRELIKILTRISFKQCLVFCNYQTRVGELHKMLTRKKWPAEQLYGKQEQNDRLDAIKTLQAYKCRLLISTDLAARGIDASNVDLVVNFEPPFEWQTYLHRIGRAGRYGSYGMAVTILSSGVEQKKFLNMLAALKLSINLTSLWNEGSANDNVVNEKKKEPVLSECISIPKFLDGNYYSDLWKTISKNNDNADTIDNVESFEELNKSFKDIEINGTEPFSDLLKSFNNNNLPDLNENFACQYKSMKISNILAKDYSNKIKCIKESTLEGHNQICNNDTLLCHEISNNTENNQNINKYEYVVPAENGCHHDTINLQNKRNIENKANNPNIEKKQDIELLKLGLPIAFSSSKDKLRKHNSRSAVSFINSSKFEFIKKNTFNSSDSSNSHHYSENNKEKPNTLRTSQITNVNESESNLRGNQKLKCNKNKRSAYCHSQEESSSVTDFKTFQKISNKHNINNAYLNWYHQLKMQVKHIQLALYIDELSKL